MVALRDGMYTHVPLNRVISGVKRVDVDEMYDVEQYRPKIADMLGQADVPVLGQTSSRHV